MGIYKFKLLSNRIGYSVGLRQLTCLSCLSHFGAIFGIASFSCLGRAGTPLKLVEAPSLMDSRSAPSMGSYSALVCSIAQKWFDCKARFSLTTNGVVLNTEELGLVV